MKSTGVWVPCRFWDRSTSVHSFLCLDEPCHVSLRERPCPLPELLNSCRSSSPTSHDGYRLISNSVSEPLSLDPAVRDVQTSPVILSQPSLEPMERPRMCPASYFSSTKPVQVGGGSRHCGLNRPVGRWQWPEKLISFLPSFAY